MNQLKPISPEHAEELASFRTLIKLELSYDPEGDGNPPLNIALKLSGQGNDDSPSQLLFTGVRQLDIRLSFAEPQTEEVLVTSLKADQLEDLTYKVSSDLGTLEFHFFCKEIQGSIGQAGTDAHQ